MTMKMQGFGTRVKAQLKDRVLLVRFSGLGMLGVTTAKFFLRSNDDTNLNYTIAG